MVWGQSSSNKYTIMTEGNGGLLFFDLTPGTARLQTTEVVLYIVCVRWPCSNTVHVEPDQGPLSPRGSCSPSPILRLLQKDTHGGRKEGEKPREEEEEEEGENQEGAGGQAVAQADINSKLKVYQLCLQELWQIKRTRSELPCTTQTQNCRSKVKILYNNM